MPMGVGLAGPAYAVVATALGLLFIWLSMQFAQQRSQAHARRLFLFSIIYLPLLWAALVIDRIWL
jgi:protoheme IX farnesyltransferase